MLRVAFIFIYFYLFLFFGSIWMLLSSLPLRHGSNVTVEYQDTKLVGQLCVSSRSTSY